MSDSRPNISVDSFLQTTRKSGLVDDARIQQVIDQLPEGLSGEAAAVARHLVEQNLITDWQASKLLRGKHKGFSLGKYRLLKLLGKGGMSSVYLAEHTLMRRRCALKVLPIGRVDDSSWLARFHREAQAIAALDHPNIVRAYDIDHEEDGDRNIHFLVMEYVDGRSIQEIVLEDGPLSLDHAADYFRQAALGLEHAHRAGLVHRDVKPGNLLVDQSGVVKVLDLGLALFSEVVEETPLTVAHDERVLGTADYLSPEQALDSHTVDARADVYSLGCSIYFGLTGRPPFKDGSLAQRLMAHQLKDAPAIGKFRPEMEQTESGRAFTAIIRRMMARDPAERFQTMSDVAAALADWEQHSSPPASSTPLAGLITPAAAPPGVSAVATAARAPGAPSPAVAAPLAQPVNPTAVPVAAQAVPVAAPVARAVSPGAGAPLAKPVVPVASVPAAVPVAQPTPGASPAVPPPSVPTASPVPPATANPSPEATGTAPGVIAGESAHDTSLASGSTANETDGDSFDPSLIPTPADGPGDFPSILGGTSGSVTAPQAVTDARDFTQTETFVPQSVESSDTPDFSGTGGEPVFPSAAAGTGEPAVEPSPIDEFLEPLTDDDGPDELDRTLITPAGGSSFADMASPESSSAPVFPASPTAPFAPDSAAPFAAPPAVPFASEPVAPVAPQFPAATPEFPTAEPVFAPEPAPFAPAAPVQTPFAQPPDAQAPFAASPVSAPPDFPSGFDAAGFEPGGFPAPEPAFGQPAFGQPVMGQPAATSFPEAASYPHATPAQPAATNAQPAGRRKQGIPTMLIIGVLVLLIAAGGGAWFFLSGKDAKSAGKKSTAASSGSSKSSGTKSSSTSGKSTRSSAPVSSGALKTNLTVGPGREYKTIAAALTYVRANKSRYPDITRKSVVRIEVAGGESFSEAIEIDNSGNSFPAGIQINSTNEFPFTLKPPGGGPAIRLVSIEHLQLDGFQIDASGLDVAIELEGFLNRTTLSNVDVSGFRQTGILGKGIAGVLRDEVVFDHVDLRPADAAAVGIKLTSGKASTGRINIHDCRLFGPQAAGILLDNGAIGIDIRRTIFDQAGMGVSFAVGPLEWRDIRIVNCTFHQIGQAAIHFSDMPVTGSSGMEFRRNLFAGMKGPELKVAAGYNDKGFDPFLSTQLGSVDLNWSDRSQPADPANGERELIANDEVRKRRVPSIQFFSTDRNADDFLTPQRGTPYSSVGVRPGDDGDPFIGARPRPE
ncbi:protein kinase [bacterium]|nr:protein kinase [bacterium]